MDCPTLMDHISMNIHRWLMTDTSSDSQETGVCDQYLIRVVDLLMEEREVDEFIFRKHCNSFVPHCSYARLEEERVSVVYHSGIL